MIWIRRIREPDTWIVMIKMEKLLESKYDTEIEPSRLCARMIYRDGGSFSKLGAQNTLDPKKWIAKFLLSFLEI